MPSRYPVEVRRQVVELARSGTRVAQLAETFGMTQASIYSWLKQDRIDRGEAPGLSTGGQMELAAAKRRIRQLETELAASRKVNEVFLEQNLPQKPLPGDLVPDGRGFDVQTACLMLGVAPSGYYDWKVRPPSARTLKCQGRLKVDPVAPRSRSDSRRLSPPCPTVIARGTMCAVSRAL